MRGTSFALVPERYGHIAYGVLQSALTCAIATAVSSVSDGLGLPIVKWAVSWLWAWLAMLPVVLLVSPLLRRIVGRLTRPAGDDYG
ncbi:DUF2798 domain-containing protein [Mesorhizobium sp. B2-3-5]|uniref:DUF2798 domain-containing protein n=1 Tax=Mesorhizobium sp. B2-3-5 TaxID=2589958 RepID=UPI00112BF4E4|nr:DUF2798 domain-containing protein [Mesorhizobium sp. B2-3-5]TPM26876.1 DUF2798 domain-containing protein [Mesorhizobium sp. B2-3-5]